MGLFDNTTLPDPVEVVTPVPPFATAIVVPLQVPLVIVPTVVNDDDPAKGDAPTLLYDIVFATDPLYVNPLASPEPLLFIVNALVTEPALPVVF